MSTYIYTGGELYHHGIKGQKWGVRRFQNEDGTLTPAGKKRYNEDSDKLASAAAAQYRAIAEYRTTATEYIRDKARNPETADQSKVDASVQKVRYTSELVSYGKNYLKDHYKSVEVDYYSEAKTGEIYARAILETEAGEQYISEFYVGAKTEPGRRDRRL